MVEEPRIAARAVFVGEAGAAEPEKAPGVAVDQMVAEAAATAVEEMANPLRGAR